MSNRMERLHPEGLRALMCAQLFEPLILRYDSYIPKHGIVDMGMGFPPKLTTEQLADLAAQEVDILIRALETSHA